MKPSDIKYLIVHCSGSDWGNANAIRSWHTDPKPRGNGWADIGYHYVVQNRFPTYRSWARREPVKGSDGTVVAGRPVDMVGSHCLGYNAKSLGICLVGKGTDASDPEYDFTDTQFQALISFIEELMAEYSIPVENVLGHRETPKTQKTCPNLDMGWLREQLES
jgi:hypothetical protein